MPFKSLRMQNSTFEVCQAFDILWPEGNPTLTTSHDNPIKYFHTFVAILVFATQLPFCVSFDWHQTRDCRAQSYMFIKREIFAVGLNVGLNYGDIWIIGSAFTVTRQILVPFGIIFLGEVGVARLLKVLADDT